MRGQEGGVTGGNATTSQSKTTSVRRGERITRGRCDKRQRNNQPLQ
jgi:hypothetical protein